MLVLTGYYGEVRQHLEWENVTVIMLTCTASLWLSTGKKKTLDCVVAHVAYTFQFLCVYTVNFPACVRARDGGVCDCEKSMWSRRSDLTADRLWRRDGGATSAAQLRGNPWHGVSYWANTEVSSWSESTSSLKFTEGQNPPHYREDGSFRKFCMNFAHLEMSQGKVKLEYGNMSNIYGRK